MALYLKVFYVIVITCIIYALSWLEDRPSKKAHSLMVSAFKEFGEVFEAGFCKEEAQMEFVMNQHERLLHIINKASVFSNQAKEEIRAWRKPWKADFFDECKRCMDKFRFALSTFEYVVKQKNESHRNMMCAEDSDEDDDEGESPTPMMKTPSLALPMAQRFRAAMSTPAQRAPRSTVMVQEVSLKRRHSEYVNEEDKNKGEMPPTVKRFLNLPECKRACDFLREQQMEMETLLDLLISDGDEKFVSPMEYQQMIIQWDKTKKSWEDEKIPALEGANPLQGNVNEGRSSLEADVQCIKSLVITALDSMMHAIFHLREAVKSHL
jgi:hypothetical protein